MGADTLSQVCTWFDAAYRLHPNLKIHTDGCMSFGYSMIHCKSIKQTLSTQKSTEAEVVGLSDYLPYNIWFCLSTGAQGYDMEQNILFQDNQCTINME